MAHAGFSQVDTLPIYCQQDFENFSFTLQQSEEAHQLAHVEPKQLKPNRSNQKLETLGLVLTWPDSVGKLHGWTDRPMDDM